jgi:hypothetical protein
VGDVGAVVTGPFEVSADEYRLRLEPIERAVLRSIVGVLDLGDDAGGRLDYTAHPGDPDADRRYRDLVAGSLDELRVEDRRRFETVVSGAASPPAAVESFMRVVGEIRLILAARAGIEDDGWEQDAATDDPEVAMLGWLGHLQDAAVGVLMGRLET